MWTAMGYALQPVLSTASSIPKIKRQPQAPVLPTGCQPQKETDIAIIDDKLQRLAASKEKWAQLPAQERAVLLDKCMRNLLKLAPEISEACVKAKGSYGQGPGEDLLGMFPTVLALKEYIMSLRHNGQWEPMKVHKAPGTDQLVAKVFPWGALPAVTPGFNGEVWMAPGQPATQGKLYRDKAEGSFAGKGGVALVLGAGNQFCVALLDIFHKLVADDQVVLCKMSPVIDYLTPLFEEALQPLISEGYLELVCGGVQVGKHVVAHPGIDSIHLTGSEATFNNIVWGQPKAPADGEPVCKKEVTAELGNVTPYIIIPGPWTAQDIKRQAGGVVSGLIMNASHNCLAAELLIMPSGWPLRDAFMAELKRQLQDTYQRAAYYPGSKEKLEAFKNSFNSKGVQVLELGKPVPGSDSQASIGSGNAQSYPYPVPPWLLAPGLTPDTAITDKENWVGVLQEVVLPYSDPGNATADNAAPAAADQAAGRKATLEYMSAVKSFVNDKVWGSLTACVVCHPQTMKLVGDEEWHRFIGDLRYGCISVNVPTVMAFCATALPWGGAPGNTPRKVESGIGFVHNTRLFDHAVKGVVYAPWHVVPYPFFLSDNWAVAYMAMPLLNMVANLDNLGKMLNMTQLAVEAVRGGK